MLQDTSISSKNRGDGYWYKRDISSWQWSQMARQYDLPVSVAAFRLFNEIRDYNKIGGIKKELSTLYFEKFAINEDCSCQR